MEMSEFSIFKGKKVLLTGHTGFKGSWLAIWLEMLGAEVIGLALDPLDEDGVFTRSGIGQRITDYRCDIRDLEKVRRIFSDEKPEIVLHLAAQPLVLESYAQPVDTFAVNVMGTAHILEAIRHTSSVRAGVMVTTDKCYENKEWVFGYRESDPMGGHDPYSASKGAAEIVISSYRRSFFSTPGQAAIASARSGNVIGGGDWAANRLVPDVIRAEKAGQALEVRRPDSTRPWQHVLEPLSGYLLLAAKLLEAPDRYASAWNFGPLPTQVYSVRQVVEAFLQHLGKGEWRDVSDPDQPHEAGLLMLEISKAIHELGWKPVLQFQEMIRLTADWYARYTKDDVLGLCREQINQYRELWRSRNGN
ncbi:MAG: CDP-glucose 4,6-dehydratase [Lewinellaceae bacterium]|nr:CDP-glucose 4,6-dehydratase [Lewinellaceae bacterium]